MASTHPRVELIFVTAPETGATARLSDANLHVEPGRRQISYATCIDERTFDLKEVGAVPGLELEYLEEQQCVSGSAAADNGKNPGILDVARMDNLEEDEPEKGAAGQDNDAAFEPTLAAGAPSEDSASTILDEDDSSDSIAPDEDLSTEIEKAMYSSMVRSIRNTTVLSTKSKRLTMQNMNRIRNSLFNAEASSEDGNNDTGELIDFNQP